MIKPTPIQAIRTFHTLPHVYQTVDNKIMQLSYYDSRGRLISFREIKPKQHMGRIYYRIGKERYSELKLETLAKPCKKKINLLKEVVRLTETKSN